MTKTINQEVHTSELKTGDSIRIGGGPFSDATVRNVDRDGKWFEIFRPHVVTANFGYTGGVLCTIGIEIFTRSIGSHPEDTVFLYNRKELK